MENPYIPPHSADIPNIATTPRLTVLNTICFLAVGSFEGTALGAFINSINGGISPQLFIDRMNWRGMNIWTAAICQGALEGGIYGLFFAIVFLIMLFTLSQYRCDLRTAIFYSFLALLTALCCSFMGGLFFVGFAYLIPNQCSNRFFGYDRTWPTLAYYAWASGTIAGSIWGGLIAVLFSNSVYAIRQLRAPRSAQSTNTLSRPQSQIKPHNI